MTVAAVVLRGQQAAAEPEGAASERRTIVGFVSDNVKSIRLAASRVAGDRAGSQADASAADRTPPSNSERPPDAPQLTGMLGSRLRRALQWHGQDAAKQVRRSRRLARKARPALMRA
jgi:hypothetical protein